MDRVQLEFESIYCNMIV